MKKFIFLFFLFLTACKASESVVIEAPVDTVWEYVSDSTRAADWSIYFDHISPLPGVPDGQVGSLRRCFRRADEQGMFWDEEVTRLEPPRLRELRTFNVTGHPEKKLNEMEYKVEQIYESLSPRQTRLTFQAEVTKGMDLKALYYMLRDSREGARVLRSNLENIKAQIENRGRPHPYEQQTKWD